MLPLHLLGCFHTRTLVADTQWPTPVACSGNCWATTSSCRTGTLFEPVAQPSNRSCLAVASCESSHLKQCPTTSVRHRLPTLVSSCESGLTPLIPNTANPPPHTPGLPTVVLYTCVCQNLILTLRFESETRFHY